jgi:hypothetical protein
VAVGVAVGVAVIVSVYVGEEVAVGVGVFVGVLVRVGVGGAGRVGMAVSVSATCCATAVPSFPPPETQAVSRMDTRNRNPKVFLISLLLYGSKIQNTNDILPYCKFRIFVL